MVDDDTTREIEQDSGEDRGSDPIGALLKSALSDAPVPEASLLPSIQERIRIRTKGRYYRDRWSSARHPVVLLLATALLLVILGAALFLVMESLMEAERGNESPNPAQEETGPAPTRP